MLYSQASGPYPYSSIDVIPGAADEDQNDHLDTTSLIVIKNMCNRLSSLNQTHQCNRSLRVVILAIHHYAGGMLVANQNDFTTLQFTATSIQTTSA